MPRTRLVALIEFESETLGRVKQGEVFSADLSQALYLVVGGMARYLEQPRIAPLEVRDGSECCNTRSNASSVPTGRKGAPEGYAQR